jgi:hypothetical protein
MTVPERTTDDRHGIAARIDLGLRRHLGEGVDPQRTVDDPLYARDVLLVCDAMTDTDLPALAREFRAAAAAPERVARVGRDPGPPQEWSADTSGFGLTTPPAAPGADAAAPADDPAAPPPRPWYSPKRWFSS